MFRELVAAFPDGCWETTVEPVRSPRRFGIHAVQSVDVYLNLRPEDVDRKGLRDWQGPLESLPDRDELLGYAEEVLKRLHQQWGDRSDDDLLEPTAFEWTGSTRLGQHAYCLRHLMFHLGEMAMLARQSGVAEAPWH